GKVGYINEVFFKTDRNVKNSRSNSTTSSSSNKPSRQVWSEYSLKENWREEGIDEIEGVYEGIVSTYARKTGAAVYKLALKKNNSGYELIYLAGVNNQNKHLWSQGQTKA